jgi:proteasome beta subunit
MQYAMGVLEQEYADDLTAEEGKTVAARAVKSAVERDTASGNGVHITEITRDSVTTEGYESFEDLI